MSMDFEPGADDKIVAWDSAEVYSRLADISERPEPGDDDWRCLGNRFVVGIEDLDFLPDVYFFFLDGHYLVWGAYWIDRFDPRNCILASIERIPQPFPLPLDFRRS